MGFERGIGQRTFDQPEVARVGTDVELDQARLGAPEPVERQVIQELVREDASRRRGLHLLEGAQRSQSRASKPRPSPFAPLDRGVDDCRTDVRRKGGQDALGQGPIAGAHLDHLEGGWSLERLPELRDLPRHERGEHGRDVRAREEIGVLAGPRTAVEAELGVVQRELDDLVEWQRPQAPGSLPNELCYFTSDAASPDSLQP